MARRQIHSKKLQSLSSSGILLYLTFSLFMALFCPRSIRPESLFFQSHEEQKKSKQSSDSSLEVFPVTPDVDLLLQCSFSYMHQAEESDSQEQHPSGRSEETFVDPEVEQEAVRSLT